jgi:hypothetical protein
VPSEPEQPDPRVLDVMGKQLDRYQAVIARLADNQVQVKTWCVTALGALAAVSVSSGERGLLVIGVAVLFTFFFLDAYYLSLERHFRAESRRSVDKLLSTATPCDWTSGLTMEGPGRGQRQAWQAVRMCGGSLAITPFYLGLMVMLVIGFALA